MSHHDEELYALLARMALAGDGVVLGLGLGVLAVRTWLKFRSHSMALKQVHETPVTRIADLRSLVQEKEDNDKPRDSGKRVPVPRQLAFFSEEVVAAKSALKSVSKQESRLVIVRGRVYPRTTVQLTETNGEPDAVVAQNGKEKGVFLERTQTVISLRCFGSLLLVESLASAVLFAVFLCFIRHVLIFFLPYVTTNLVQYMHTEMNSLLGWITQKDLVTLTRKMVPFVLSGSSTHRDSTKSQVFVHIQLDDPLRQPLPLVTVYHKLHPVPASSYTFFQAMFGRRYPVGLLDEEKILPIGKEITAVGILSASSDGNPMIHACKHLPCFLSEGTHEQLVTELATGTKVLMWTGIAVSTVAAVILSYAFVKNWTKWKARQRERQRRDEETRQDTVLSDYDLEDVTDLPDGELCVVCLLRRRRAAFIYCGHRVCCVSCAQRIEQGTSARCPVCRQSVTGYVRVFDS